MHALAPERPENPGTVRRCQICRSDGVAKRFVVERPHDKLRVHRHDTHTLPPLHGRADEIESLLFAHDVDGEREDEPSLKWQRARSATPAQPTPRSEG